MRGNKVSLSHKCIGGDGGCNSTDDDSNSVEIINIFGILCTDASPNNKQYFVDGRIVRKITVWEPMPELRRDELIEIRKKYSI